MDTAFCIRQQNFAQEGRGPHIALDDRILLQMTASRFRRPHFASDGCILLRAIAFCFRWPRFALDDRILLWTAAQLVESVWDCCIHFIEKKPLSHEWRGERSEWESERVSGASERANGRTSGLILHSVFLAVIDHSEIVVSVAGRRCCCSMSQAKYTVLQFI